jgi:hypothetical protein
VLLAHLAAKPMSAKAKAAAAARQAAMDAADEAPSLSETAVAQVRGCLLMYIFRSIDHVLNLCVKSVCQAPQSSDPDPAEIVPKTAGRLPSPEHPCELIWVLKGADFVCCVMHPCTVIWCMLCCAVCRGVQAQREIASLLLPGESVTEGLRRLAAAGGGAAAGKGKGEVACFMAVCLL